jgi:CcmD family protein
MKNKFLLFLTFLLANFSAFAQDIEMADNMRQNGKIYVVVAVVLVILIGLFFYLFRIEKKLNDLENRLKK